MAKDKKDETPQTEPDPYYGDYDLDPKDADLDFLNEDDNDEDES